MSDCIFTQFSSLGRLFSEVFGLLVLHFWHISLLLSRKHTEPRCGWFVKFMFNCYMSEYIIFSSLFIYCLCISATACCASFAVCLVCCICHLLIYKFLSTVTLQLSNAKEIIPFSNCSVQIQNELENETALPVPHVSSVIEKAFFTITTFDLFFTLHAPICAVAKAMWHFCPSYYTSLCYKQSWAVNKHHW